MFVAVDNHGEAIGNFKLDTKVCSVFLLAERLLQVFEERSWPEVLNVGGEATHPDVTHILKLAEEEVETLAARLQVEQDSHFLLHAFHVFRLLQLVQEFVDGAHMASKDHVKIALDQIDSGVVLALVKHDLLEVD